MSPEPAPTPTFADWLARVREELGGRDPLATLSSRPVGGPTIRPLYTAADAPDGGPFRSDDRHGGRRLAFRPSGGTPREINHSLLAGLAGGASAVRLPPAARRDREALDLSLHDVLLEAIALHLGAGAESENALQTVREWLAGRGIAPADLEVRIDADPLAVLARQGSLEGPLDRALAEVGAVAVTCHRELPGWRAAEVDGSPFHEAGADDAQELGALLAASVTYLRAMEGAGLSTDAAVGQIGWSVALGSDLFTQIAKLRAAREIWRRLQAALGISESRPLALHAESSRRGLTRYDRWVNVLRGTSQAAAALIGGADEVTVVAFDSALGTTTASARRLAWNTVHVLELESALATVDDPAGGSWYVESLTDELARRAWDEMRRIEGEGGLAASLTGTGLATRLAERAGERHEAIVTREIALTGISEYAQLDEPLPPTREADHVSTANRTDAPALPVLRDAAPFERLRDAAARAVEEPAVFLANLGPAKRHGARSLFAVHALAAGGVRAIPGEGTDARDASAAAAALVSELRESGARAVCLCGDDELYESLGEAAVEALRTAGATPLWVAVPPGDLADQLLKAGAQEIVHRGCDLVQRLEGLHAALGVEPAEDAR